jgi:hypothetical protein
VQLYLHITYFFTLSSGHMQYAYCVFICIHEREIVKIYDMSTGLGTQYLVNGSFWCDDVGQWINGIDYNCTYFDRGCWCPQLKADADIAGIGVSIYQCKDETIH